VRGVLRHGWVRLQPQRGRRLGLHVVRGPTESCAPALMQHGGDMSADDDLTRACKACYGEKATLQFIDGRTSCAPPSAPGSASLTEPLPPPGGRRLTAGCENTNTGCGEGIGNWLADKERKAECEACCATAGFVYNPSAADGLGYTWCVDPRSPAPPP